MTPTEAGGLEVTALVRLVGQQGRRLQFEVQAHDGIDLISRGTHERAIVDCIAFSERRLRKAGSPGH